MVYLTDGGLGTYLQSYVGDEVEGGLWSARCNVTRPDAVLAAHRDFLQAGSDLIRTNTYQASAEGYKKYLNMPQEEAEETFRKTIGLAFQARREYLEMHPGRDVKVLVSIGPYGAFLNDGSEYTGAYGITIAEAAIREFHKKRLDVVLREKVDGLAIETIPRQREAEILVDLLNEFYPETKFWLTFSCKDGDSLVHGESFKEAVESVWNRVADKKNILAIGINCLDPKFVTPLLTGIGNKRRTDPIPLVAYPNSGEVFDTTERKWTDPGNTVDILDEIPKWVELGAKYVGGCCRTDPRRIKKMREFIDERYGTKK